MAPVSGDFVFNAMGGFHMKVLVVGRGPREHAIIWKAAASDRVTELFAAPGNPGIASHATCIRAGSPSELSAWAARTGIDLVIVGPEDQLASGVTDAMDRHDIPTLGPGTRAVLLESSKRWAKERCAAEGIPIPRYESFTDSRAAKSYCRSLGAPLVVKADGLAQGKGAVVCHTLTAADAAIEAMLDRGTFGVAGSTILVEEFLTGFECSYMFFTDGRSIATMPTTQDHKPVGTRDVGPNTGGMGAYTPVANVDAALEEAFHQRIGRPLLKALAAQSIDYRGVVCANLMVTADGPVVLEFNARFGDPEAEMVLPLLNTDLIDVAEAVAGGRLDQVKLAWSDQAALCVAMAAHGYPTAPRVGDVITGFDRVDAANGSLAFLGGTAWSGGQLVTAGGRVVIVTGIGASLADAAVAAYDRVDRIRFAGEHHRTDIGFRSLGGRFN
jgi:phosphoribosylamine--glycine ligase